MTMESRERHPCIKLSGERPILFTFAVWCCSLFETVSFLDADQALPQFLELSDMFFSICGTLSKLRATDRVYESGKECLDTVAEALLQ